MADGAAPVTQTFKWDDPFLFEDELDDDERAVCHTARGYATDRLMPHAKRGEH